MNNQRFNLFIVDDNAQVVRELSSYLGKRFGADLNISTFTTSESVLAKVNEETRIVIVDYDLKNENGGSVLSSIKEINPQTEVIVLSSNEDVGIAIDSFRKGAADVVIKGKTARRRISYRIYDILAYPVNIIVKEFGLSKFMAIILMTFVTVGVVVFITLSILK